MKKKTPEEKARFEQWAKEQLEIIREQAAEQEALENRNKRKEEKIEKKIEQNIVRTNRFGWTKGRPRGPRDPAVTARILETKRKKRMQEF